jgi:hypothetical protein
MHQDSNMRMKAVIVVIVAVFTAVALGQKAKYDYKMHMPDYLRTLSRDWPMRSIPPPPAKWNEKYTERKGPGPQGPFDWDTYYLSLIPQEVRAVLPPGDVKHVGRLIYDGPMFFQVTQGKEVVAIVRLPGWSGDPKVWIRPNAKKSRQLCELLPFSQPILDLMPNAQSKIPPKGNERSESGRLNAQRLPRIPGK